MNPTDPHPDALAQARADALERRGAEGPQQAPPRPVDAALVDAAAVADYRLLHRAVRSAPMPALPAGFAAAIGTQVRDLEERADPEHWTILLAAGCALAAAALFALPVTASALHQAMANLDGAPWPMLVTAGFALAAAWAGDRLASRRTLPRRATAGGAARPG